MPRYASSSAAVSVQTSNYQIGDVADFAGLPVFYDNGLTQWMQTGQWVDGSLPNTVVKATLSKVPLLAALTKNVLLETFEFLNTFLPPATLANVASIPAQVGANMYSLTVDANGINCYQVALSSGFGNPASTGSAHSITSDGTTLWAWWPNATQFLAANSTDGKTWSAAALTGLPAWTSPATNVMGPLASQSTIDGTGENFQGGCNIAAYCGARHLMIGPNGAGNALASRSANGLAWGGDESATILGATNIALAGQIWYYRNGNNFFLTINGTYRYTTDGGVNWGTPSGAVPASPAKFRVNSSDPARLMSWASALNANFSSNSGVSWVARVLPIVPTTLYGIGSTWIISNGTTAYRSVDDGANWSLIALPASTAGAIRGAYADANRFYLHTTANQMLTSTDAINWTVRNIATPEGTSVTLWFCSALDANTVVFATIPHSGDTAHLYTTDGGVTFKWAKRSASSVAPSLYSHYYRAVSAGGTKALIAGSVKGGGSKDAQSILLPADLANSGAAFRVSTNNIGSLHSGSNTFARVS